MCGIVGIIDNGLTTKALIKAMKTLEYRGYDSAGIAYFENDDFIIKKAVGKIDNLDNIVDNKNIALGIGHTRWATNGIVNLENCHPQYSKSKRYIVIHNGVLSNYLEIKDKFFNGIEFTSQTDTEVIARLFDEFGNLDTLNKLKCIVKLLKGSFSFLVIDTNEKDKIYFCKNKTPLIIGIGKNSKMIASDILAFDSKIKKLLRLEDYTVGYIGSNDSLVECLSEKCNKVFQPFVKQKHSTKKGHYEHYMLKEIFEQKEVVERIIDDYTNIEGKLIDKIEESSEVIFLAAGSSYYAGLYCASLCETILAKRANAYLASEFAYNPKIFNADSLFVFISQSGETADLIECLEQIAENKKVILTNNIFSSLSVKCDMAFDILAYPEISVASTKAYFATVLIFYVLITKNRLNELNMLFEGVTGILGNQQIIKNYALDISKYDKVFYLGRNTDYYACLEGALKLKEIAYLNSCAYQSGELKHGTLALIDSSSLTVAINTQEKTKYIVNSNINEIKSRGGKTIVIDKKNQLLKHLDINEGLMSLLCVIMLQLIAYHTARLRNCEIDMPKNLAKSVTVE